MPKQESDDVQETAGSGQVVHQSQPFSADRENTTFVQPSSPRAEMAIYAGPLPPPAVLQGYERIHPGAAAAIFDEFLAQSSHRRSMEAKVIDSDIRRERWGMIAGIAVCLTAFGVAAFATHLGHTAIAIAFGVVPVSGLVGVFLKTSHDRRLAMEAKQKQENQPE